MCTELLGVCAVHLLEVFNSQQEHLHVHYMAKRSTNASEHSLEISDDLSRLTISIGSRQH